MKNDQNITANRTLPVLLPEKGIFRPILRAFYSIKNFAKASVLSILVLLVIFLLLSQMEQAYTMFLRMIEHGKPSLLLCFVLVFLLAMGLSHFPIYTYYAGNLNGSRKYVEWEKPYQPYQLPFLRRIRIYSFNPYFPPNYVKDIYANVLRQYLGLSLFLIWIHFIFSTFKPNLIYTIDHFYVIQFIVYSIASIPFIGYLILRRKLSKLHSTIEERRVIFIWLGKLLLITSLIAAILLIFIAFSNHLFSKGGLLVLLLATFFLMVSFTLFRLVRPRLKHTIKWLNDNNNTYFAKVLSLLQPVQSSVKYLQLFHWCFFFSIGAITYFNLASLNNWLLPNGIAIVLVYLYAIFFLVSVIGKYFFVKFSYAEKAREKGEPLDSINSPSFQFVAGSLIVVSLMFISGFFTESTSNELTIYPQNPNFNTEDLSIQDRIPTMSDTVFFVSSHGGGLKANAWTLLTLNELQTKSDGKFIKNCIAFSGASGGSVGLALYGNLYGLYGSDFSKIATKIDSIRNENYASVDISMLFGLDAVRIMWPLNGLPYMHDRSYYGMVKYQNIILSKPLKALSEITFKSYWNQLQQHGNYLPILMMNTAATNGQRGIFCTMETDSFSNIFPFSKNLANLKLQNGNNGAVSFYQAVSTTNRFPIFSPIAKIKGYGHFIDAGAIDNTGLLSNWDLYLHLRETGRLKNKTVVFVDIENSKSGYIRKVLKTFLKEHQEVVLKEEKEKSAIMANLQTGLSLDKIPGYLTDFMYNYTSFTPNIEYKPIFLPHKISMADVEDEIEGEILNGVRVKLDSFLKVHNDEILQTTEADLGFWDDWQTYEPVLSRHLSTSNNTYYNKIISNEKTGINTLLDYCK